MQSKKEKFNRLVLHILRWMFIKLPHVVIYFGLALMAANIYAFFWGNKSLDVSINILISSVILTATLSVLGFTYLQVLNKKERDFKEILYCSERFLHSTILMIISLIIFWTIGNYYPSLEKLAWFKYVGWFSYFIISLAYICLLDAAKYLGTSINILERILSRKERESGNRSEWFS